MSISSAPSQLREPKEEIRATAKKPLLGLLAMLGAGVAGSFWILQRNPSPLFLGMTALFFWTFLAAGIEVLYLCFIKEGAVSGQSSRFATRWQWVILFCALAVFGRFLIPFFSGLGDFSQSGSESLRAFAPPSWLLPPLCLSMEASPTRSRNGFKAPRCCACRGCFNARVYLAPRFSFSI